MKEKPKGIVLVRINIEFYAFLLSQFIVRSLPLKPAMSFVKLATVLVYCFDFKHRRRTIQHMLHAGIVKTKKEARTLALKNFISMGKVFLELVKFDQFVTPENVEDFITWNMEEKTRKVLYNPEGVIYVGAHFGNWEISGLSSSILVRPLVSVMRPFDNPKIGKYIQAKRKVYNQELCNRKEAAKPLLRAIKEKKAIGIISDQHAGTKEGVETTFFGHPARTHSSPAYLHIRTGLPMILGLARRIDDNFHFEYIAKGPFTVEPSGDIEKDVQCLTQQFTTALEEIITQYPDQWLWSHRRWLDINRKKKR